MWFYQSVRHEMGCATYLIGALESGECTVFDPLWNIEPYLELAAAQGLRIRYVIDSHSHADHVSGARRLQSATGAELLMHEEADLLYPVTRVHHGQQLRMGEVIMEVVHAPGHRPEQICLLVSDTSRGPEPWCMLTADFVLVGDVARADLALASGGGATEIFETSLPRVLSLPDHVEIYPGHVMGST